MHCGPLKKAYLINRTQGFWKLLNLMWFLRILCQVDHPVFTHMSTSVYGHLQFITFTYLVLYFKVLKKTLKLNNDQLKPTLLAIFKHSSLDFLVVE